MDILAQGAITERQLIAISAEYNPQTDTWTQKVDFGGVKDIQLLVLGFQIKVILEQVMLV